MKAGLAAFLFLTCAGLQAHANDWLIEPGVRVGQIRKNTSEQTLIQIYGKRYVRQTDIYLGEGTSEAGTILFPDDPTKTLSILWKSTTTRIEPATIRINSEKTVWKTISDITIGSTLREIERLNKKPFVLTGFAWDYEGTILHSNGGSLTELGIEDSNKSIHARTLLLRLRPNSKGQSSPEYKSVLGDHIFSSQHPSMQKLNPKVYDIVVDFD